MAVERWIRLIAGTFVTLSLTLGYVLSPYFLLFTLFVGLNLAQSAVTEFCPMEVFLRRLGVGASVAAPASARPHPRGA